MKIVVLDDDKPLCESIDLWTKKYLVKNKVNVDLSFCAKADELLSELRHYDANSSGKLLVLLDLNIDDERNAGLDLLRRLRRSTNALLRSLPVVIYSNSNGSDEIEQCYLAKANSYVWKGAGGKDQKKRYTELLDYWARTASLPN